MRELRQELGLTDEQVANLNDLHVSIRDEMHQYSHRGGTPHTPPAPAAGEDIHHAECRKRDQEMPPRHVAERRRDGDYPQPWIAQHRLADAVDGTDDNGGA